MSLPPVSGLIVSRRICSGALCLKDRNFANERSKILTGESLARVWKA